MAGVFLSYVREDADKARAIAGILERSGHSVWWDRQIKGGAQYSAEIEAALDAADKVVVLWSAQSVQSAWVRDEAAAGRDSGRLVPVHLDGTAPPLGFRQFQSIDLSHWNGRSNAAQIKDLLEAVGDAAQPRVASPGTVAKRRRVFVPRYALIAVAFVLVAAVAAWMWLGRPQAGTPVVAIDTGTRTAQSQQVARQLAIRLGDLQSARNDAFRLITGSGKADIILQVDADDSGNPLRRDLSLLAGNDRSILWSTSLQQPAGKKDDLEQQLTLTSENVLSCAIEALSQRKDSIDAATLKLYLSGCSRMDSLFGSDDYDPALIDVFAQVVRKAPHFEAAWSKLLMAEGEIAKDADPPAKLTSDLRAHVAQVEKLGFAPGALYAAKASLLPQSDFGGILTMQESGIRADPANAMLYRLHAEELQRVGRMSEAVFDAHQALAFDPLSPSLQDGYMSALAYAGKTDAAFEQLQKSEAMWPNARNIHGARYRLYLRYGDPNEALALFRAAPVPLDPAQEEFIQARIDPSPANIEKAINAERALYAREPRYIAGLIQVLGQFGRKDEALDVLLHYSRPDAIGYNADVLFRPALRDVWRDPRSIAAAAHLGFLRYWKTSGHWPDFCNDPSLPYDCKKEGAKYH